MMTINPLFAINDEVYLRSSASIGMIEAVFVSGVYQRGNGWMYTFRTGMGNPQSPAIYGNRQNLNPRHVLYLSEDELITKCEALILAESSAKAIYDKIKGLRERFCP